jgi:hypothetical protein
MFRKQVTVSKTAVYSCKDKQELEKVIAEVVEYEKDTLNDADDDGVIDWKIIEVSVERGDTYEEEL